MKIKKMILFVKSFSFACEGFRLRRLKEEKSEKGLLLSQPNCIIKSLVIVLLFLSTIINIHINCENSLTKV